MGCSNSSGTVVADTGSAQADTGSAQADAGSDNMGNVDIYYYIVSQPSRSVLMFAKLNKIPHNDKPTNIFKGENKTPEFLAMNPHHTVPTFNDNGFVICQSTTMAKYMASKFKVADHWYPSDIKQRARVDELLDWHHTNIRKHGVDVFVAVALRPVMGLPALSAEEIDAKYEGLDGAMEMIAFYLKDQQFLTGNEISVADLFIANEVIQPTLCERDIYAKHPKVKAWMDRVTERLNPVWDEVIDSFKAELEAAKN